jgi:hypothetical protein
VVEMYPLEKVREIHISGGSWVEAVGHKVRRDTHDDAVPEAVWELLEKTIPRCPHLQFVVFEQIGASLEAETAAARFRDDYERLCRLIQEAETTTVLKLPDHFLPPFFSNLGTPLEDLDIAAAQEVLSEILVRSGSLSEVLDQLQRSILRNSDWEIEKWPHHMLETARQIAAKWADGHEFWKA